MADDDLLATLRRLAAEAGADRTSLLEVVRAHLQGRTLDLTATAQLGKALLALCPRLSPPLAVPPRPGRRSITVMGTSHVRFFGAHDLFLPLFIGMGPNTLCLTADSHEVTRRKVLDNLARVDPDADLILDLGAEPFYHVRNILQTRPGQETEVTGADLALMAATAGRYRSLLADMRDRLRGRLILFNVLPTHDPIGNALSLVLNEHARAACRDLGIDFLDIWPQVTDPATGGMRRDLAAQAYNDDTHLSEQAMPIVLDALRRLDVIDAPTAADGIAVWRHVFGFPVSPGGDTRIWSEADVIPANAFRSEKVAAAFVATGALHVLLPIIAALEDARVLMLNVADGFLPIALPPGAAAQVIGVCGDARALHAAARVAAFAGRDDIALVADAPDLPRRLAGRSFDVTVASAYPATLQDDLDRVAALLSAVVPGRAFLLGPADLFQSRPVPPPLALRRFFPLGNRHLPGAWAGYGLFLA
ncbi:MAG: hypothetical protein WDN25_23970 [Acetobacteraceae bacterium]